jgi:uncharacterized protein
MAGQLRHVEVRAADADRAISFYSDLFGWKFTDESVMPDMDYRMTQVGNEVGAAVYPSEEAGSGLTIYFDTDDIDASVAKTRELGGEATDKMEIPGVGWFSQCKDTEGNEFSLFQGSPSGASG